jgi:hypothetical protein
MGPDPRAKPAANFTLAFPWRPSRLRTEIVIVDLVPVLLLFE